MCDGLSFKELKIACKLNKLKAKIHSASTGSKLAYVMRSTLDYFKLSMHVEITTIKLAKIRSEKQKGNLTKTCKVKTKR